MLAPERHEQEMATAAMSDRGIAQRLDAYNPDGAFGRAVAEAWSMAGPIIADVLREMIVEKLDNPRLHGIDPGMAATNRDGIVNHVMEALHYKFTHELDAEWVRRIAGEAVGINRHAMSIPMVVASKIANASRTAARIQEAIDDPALAARLAATLHQLCAFEIEISLWQVGELRRCAAASDRARQSETFHHDVSETLVVALKDAQVLHDLTDTTISSTRETLEQVAEIAAAARQSADAMNSAARTTAGLNSVLAELNEQLSNATTVTFRADDEMNHTVGTSSTLSEEVQAITSIVGVIREIAGQTNLLALNATIEAARAGDAGRGFAVVAQEVKSLAAQTARATDAIAGRIVGIQSANAQSVASVTSVQQTIAAVRATAERMAEKVAGQSVQVSQIAEAVDETATTARTVSRLVESITERTRTTVEDVVRLGQGFGRVDDQLARMDAVTTRFVGAIAA